MLVPSSAPAHSLSSPSTPSSLLHFLPPHSLLSSRPNPAGDDENTHRAAKEVQSFSCVLRAGALPSTFNLMFQREKTVDVSITATASEVAAAIQGLSGLGGVAVAASFSQGASVCAPVGIAPVVTTLSFDTAHDLPALLLRHFSPHDVSMDLTTKEEVKGSIESEVCNGRGLCDSLEGVCRCFPGYGSSGAAGGVGERGDCGWVVESYQGHGQRGGALRNHHHYLPPPSFS
jgi:hypothetical protein